MLVTLAGMVIDVKLIAPWNAPSPILVNCEPEAKVIDSNFDALLKT